jgi:hypothetical protein
MRAKPVLLLSLLIALGLPASAARGDGKADPLFDAFREPPARLRPFVRWWWNGSRVTEAEIRRELDVLKAAGIGGVEINTIAMRDDVPKAGLAAFPERPWLSPAWCAAVKTAAEGARERGMTADIIVGSGSTRPSPSWPPRKGRSARTSRSHRGSSSFASGRRAGAASRPARSSARVRCRRDG